MVLVLLIFLIARGIVRVLLPTLVIMGAQILIALLVVAVHIVSGLKAVIIVVNVMALVMMEPKLEREIYIRTQIAMAKEILL
jgi:hypothetical protein